MNALRFWSNSKCHLSRQELSKADIQDVGTSQMLYSGKQVANKAPESERKLSYVPAFCPDFSHILGLWGVFLLSQLFSHIAAASLSCFSWVHTLCKPILETHVEIWHVHKDIHHNQKYKAMSPSTIRDKAVSNCSTHLYLFQKSPWNIQ